MNTGMNASGLCMVTDHGNTRREARIGALEQGLQEALVSMDTVIKDMQDSDVRSTE